MTTADFITLANQEAVTAGVCLILAVLALGTLGVACAIFDSWAGKGDGK